jgi:hypothetical protein
MKRYFVFSIFTALITITTVGQVAESLKKVSDSLQELAKKIQKPSETPKAPQEKMDTWDIVAKISGTSKDKLTGELNTDLGKNYDWELGDIVIAVVQIPSSKSKDMESMFGKRLSKYSQLMVTIPKEAKFEIFPFKKEQKTVYGITASNSAITERNNKILSADQLRQEKISVVDNGSFLLTYEVVDPKGNKRAATKEEFENLLQNIQQFAKKQQNGIILNIIKIGAIDMDTNVTAILWKKKPGLVSGYGD